jgi:hypothetical protein
MTNEQYNTSSAATFLFWTRIMKEHAMFIESSLPPTQSRLARQAKNYHCQFAGISRDVINLSDGVLPQEVLDSKQFYTDFTQTAEHDFERFFGITANITLTVSEQHIDSFKSDIASSSDLRLRFSAMNKRLLEQTESFISFQTSMLDKRYLCEIFFGLYPSALKHLMNEAKRFVEEIKFLESTYEAQSDSYIVFWNRGMSEHAKSLRGELDWSEDNDIRTANYFATSFDELSSVDPNRKKSLEYNTEFEKYADTVTRNFIECKLKGIMSGLYCDHLLREVNHFTYLLRQ